MKKILIVVMALSLAGLLFSGCSLGNAADEDISSRLATCVIVADLTCPGT